MKSDRLSQCHTRRCAAPDLRTLGCAAPYLRTLGCAAPDLRTLGCAAPDLRTQTYEHWAVHGYTVLTTIMRSDFIEQYGIL